MKWIKSNTDVDDAVISAINAAKKLDPEYKQFDEEVAEGLNEIQPKIQLLIEDYRKYLIIQAEIDKTLNEAREKLESLYKELPEHEVRIKKEIKPALDELIKPIMAKSRKSKIVYEDLVMSFTSAYKRLASVGPKDFNKKFNRLKQSLYRRYPEIKSELMKTLAKFKSEVLYIQDVSDRFSIRLSEELEKSIQPREFEIKEPVKASFFGDIISWFKGVLSNIYESILDISNKLQSSISSMIELQEELDTI